MKPNFDLNNKVAVITGGGGHWETVLPKVCLNLV